MLATERVEAHDATEEDGHVVISFSRHRSLVSQLISNRLRKDRVQQPDRSVGLGKSHGKECWA